MPSLFRVSAVLFGAMCSAASFACGVCIEDKIAATYDYLVITSATARGQVIVFGQMEGTADMQKIALKIAAAAPRIRGVSGATVRTSAAPAAFSFALDPAVQAPQAAVEQLQKRLHASGVQLAVVRVVTRDSFPQGVRPTLSIESTRAK
jgi:hypothetical protein